jgi:hypothetical protein
VHRVNVGNGAHHREYALCVVTDNQNDSGAYGQCGVNDRFEDSLITVGMQQLVAPESAGSAGGEYNGVEVIVTPMRKQ